MSVVVGGSGCFLDLLASLHEQCVGLGRMAIHVEFVGVLRGRNFLIRLVDEALRFGRVGVPALVHVLGNSYTTGDQSKSQRRSGLDCEDSWTFLQGKTIPKSRIMGTEVFS